MILEAAILKVKEDKRDNFEEKFREASKIIATIPGYIQHTLNKCIEQEGKYLLLVEWQSLEDHTIGFRGSKAYEEWKLLLHHYYEPFPNVDHYEKVDLSEK